MKTYLLKILIDHKGFWTVTYKVRANSYAMAAGMCAGQTALNGWKLINVISHEVTDCI